MNPDALSIAERYDGERFELVEKFVKKFTPASEDYLLKDGSRVKRVKGMVVFVNHGFHVKVDGN